MGGGMGGGNTLCGLFDVGGRVYVSVLGML